jgi:transposase
MEGRRRRSFTQDYKRQAVEVLISSGRSVAAVAKELGLRDSVLRRWAEKQSAGQQPTAAPRRPITQATLPSADQAAEIARLQRENDRLRMERDILKKSINDLCRNTDMSFRLIEDLSTPIRSACCAPCSRSRQPAITPGGRAHPALDRRLMLSWWRQSGVCTTTAADAMAARASMPPCGPRGAAQAVGGSSC